MRIAIFGATGLLGKALMEEWSGDEVRGFGSKDADIRDPVAVFSALESSRPEWIVLAAAYTDVDGCESHGDLAFAVNTQGAVNVANAAKSLGSRLLFLSSDYVFDGAKTAPYETSDSRAPRSVYGSTKAEAECALLGILPKCCIVRTSWLFGVGGKCFPDTILKLAASRPKIEVVNDQRGCPTYARDLARGIMQLCRKQATGIVHVTNRGECTWFDFAREIVAASGLATTVCPTTSDKFVRPAARPQYSVLSPRSLEAYGIALPPWQEGLRDYLARRHEQEAAKSL